MYFAVQIGPSARHQASLHAALTHLWTLGGRLPPKYVSRPGQPLLEAGSKSHGKRDPMGTRRLARR